MKRIGFSGGVALVAMIVAGAVGTGCGGSTQQPATTATAGGDTGVPAENNAEEEQGPEADALRQFHRHHHGAGFIGFALVSIPSLGVSQAEQASVEKIRADMQAKLQPAHDAMGVLINVVADGVAAGAMDQAKVDAAIAKITEVSQQMDDATNDALNQLHATLQPPERAALALKVQAHFMIWERANADKEAHPDQEQAGGQIEHLARVIKLTPDQVQKIDAAFTASMASFTAQRQFDAKAATDHLNAFVDGFSSDHFDAKTLTTADKANSGLAQWGSMRMVKMYEAMIPVLTPDQRAALAAVLRDHATKFEAK